MIRFTARLVCAHNSCICTPLLQGNLDRSTRFILGITFSFSTTLLCTIIITTTTAHIKQGKHHHTGKVWPLQNGFEHARPLKQLSIVKMQQLVYISGEHSKGR